MGQKPAAPKTRVKPAADSNSKASGSVALAHVATVQALSGRVDVTNMNSLMDLLAE